MEILKEKRENGRTYCLIKCPVCGEEKWIRKDYVKKAKSCGCLSKKSRFNSIDITDKKFGRLTALNPTNKRDKYNGSVIWNCICECGNYKEVAYIHLKAGSIVSCGCQRTETRKANISKAVKVHLKKHIKDGTNIQVISRDKPLKSNTSGYTGVMWDKSREKWKANIEFKGKIYYLGRFKNKEDAIKARKEAEEKYHKKYLEDTDKKIKGSIKV